MSDDLRFPIGKFDLETSQSKYSRDERIAAIGGFPARLDQEVGSLDPDQLEEPYRPDGWNVKQVVHHLADSHMNSFCRFKLALTEENPTIRAYFEERWADLPDGNTEIEPSLRIIEGVHTRWAAMLGSMNEADFDRKMTHPESGSWTLDGMLSLYHWHSLHHLAHITGLCQRKGW